MSEYRKLVTEFFDRYEKPVVEKLIEGFSGIDPPLKSNAALLDHEQLDGLLGGDDTGHYHLTKEQVDWLNDLIEQLNDEYIPPDPISEDGDDIHILPGEDITDPIYIG